MKKLKPILPGDTIAFVTPASPIPAERLEFMTNLLESEGYKIKVFPHALDSADYLAGTDQDRAADLMAAFEDPEVTAVMCTRGGYGCSRILPYLDLDKIASGNKALMGFSDITVLHVALNNRGLPTIHCPMAITLSYPREEIVYESFKRVLRGDLNIPVDAPKATTVVPGVTEGVVVGGCLVLLQDSIGTPEALDCEGKILAIEGVDDPAHRVDAIFTHLRNSGTIQKAAGLLIGEMTRADERHDASIGQRPWQDIVADRVGDLGIPTLINYPFGHFKTMMSLPFGINARLDATNGTFEYTETLFES